MTTELLKAFNTGLNQHGYAFHQRVMRETARLNDNSSNGWELLSVEQPVAVGNSQSRIDFILEHREVEGQLSLLVAECKRVNPAYGIWCFAKGAYQRPPWLATQVCTEVLALESPPRSGAAGGPTSDRIFDIGFSVKMGSRGDVNPVSNDRDALEQACQQVCKGVNGLIEVLGNNADLQQTVAGIERVDFLPVIFTTAKLLTSDVDLRNTDLMTGEIETSDTVIERDWLYFQYPQSPTLLHTLNRWPEEDDAWSEIVAREYVRSIAVVSSNGIDEFINNVWPPKS